MLFYNVISYVATSRRSFAFTQASVQISASLTDISALQSQDLILQTAPSLSFG